MGSDTAIWEWCWDGARLAQPPQQPLHNSDHRTSTAWPSPDFVYLAGGHVVCNTKHLRYALDETFLLCFFKQIKDSTFNLHFDSSNHVIRYTSWKREIWDRCFVVGMYLDVDLSMLTRPSNINWRITYVYFCVSQQLQTIWVLYLLNEILWGGQRLELCRKIILKMVQLPEISKIDRWKAKRHGNGMEWKAPQSFFHQAKHQADIKGVSKMWFYGSSMWL